LLFSDCCIATRKVVVVIRVLLGKHIEKATFLESLLFSFLGVKD